MLHLPILRRGVRIEVSTGWDAAFPHSRAVVSISQANSGLIRRDLLLQGEKRRSCRRFRMRIWLPMAGTGRRTFPVILRCRSRKAARCSRRRITSSRSRPPPARRSATSSRNMLKGARRLQTRSRKCSAGLTRGLDLSVLDQGYGVRATGQMLSFFPRPTRWAPCCRATHPACTRCGRRRRTKMPLVLKPGSAEPWTPLRMIQACQGRRPGRRVRVLPDRPRRRRRDPASTGRGMVFGDTGRRSGGRRPSRRGARPRLQQSGARPRPRRPVRRVPRHDRRLEPKTAAARASTRRACG